MGLFSQGDDIRDNYRRSACLPWRKGYDKAAFLLKHFFFKKEKGLDPKKKKLAVICHCRPFAQILRL